MISNIVGYHSNSRDKSEKFVVDHELIESDDSYYLGRGMYFWDNKSNARYWAKRKIKSEKLQEVMISKANLILDEPILDLTDRETISLVREFWLKYCKKIGEYKKKQCIGKILDILHEVFPDLFGIMTIAKAHGDYSHYDKHRFFASLDENAYLDDRPKTIYAVRCFSRILDPDYFEVVTRK